LLDRGRTLKDLNKSMSKRTIDNEILISMYEKMVELRRFEEKIMELYLRGLVPSLPHLIIGQEAVSAGVVSNLRKDDYVVSSHRGHGPGIAKGISLKKVAAEIFCKATGCCRGRGGTMRIADIGVGALYSSPIVGGGIPLATGAGLSVKLRKGDQVSVAFFGDGASNTGPFHESLNLASIWKLPVIYVCENNQFAISTHVSRSTSVKNIGDRAVAYNMPSSVVDGNDVVAVYAAANEAVNRARKGNGPTLIECKTYRWTGHHVGDPGTAYRTKDEVEDWRNQCPINRLKLMLLQEGILKKKDIVEIETNVNIIVEEAIKFAEESPYPLPKDINEYVYAD
jgi:pyruvate dehydrogenase E1 component alpha subunit